MNTANKRKIIVIIAGNLYVSGVTKFIEILAKYLSQKQYHIIIIGKPGLALKNNNSLKHYDLIIIPQNEYGPGKLNKTISLLKEIILYSQALSRINKKYKITAVHFNEVVSACAILMFCPWVFSVNRVYTYHGDRAGEFKSEQVNNFIRKLKIMAIDRMQSFVVKYSSHIVAVSKYSYNHIKTKYKITAPKLSLIRNSIYPAKIKSDRIAHPDRHTDLRLLNISRFEKRKGHQILIEAIHQLVLKGYNIHLTLAGPVDSQILALLTLCESYNLFDRVQILHNASESQKDSLYRKSDLFIISSTELENCPFSVLEALSHGLPVICTPVGGLPEIVGKINSNLVAKGVNADKLRETIEKFIKLKRSQKEELVSRGRILIETDYNIYRNYPGYEALYNHYTDKNFDVI